MFVAYRRRISGIRPSFGPPSKAGQSMASPPLRRTTLGAAILPLAERHPGESGVWPLAEGARGYACRIPACRAAEASIDCK